MQEYFDYQSERAGKITVACGFAMIAAVLAGQYLLVLSLTEKGILSISEQQNARIQSFAIPTLVVLVVAVGIVLVGIRFLLESWKIREISQKNMSIIQRITKTISHAMQANKGVFWLALSLYIIVFLFTSGTVVYSEEGISDRYGVSVPSMQIIGCCGQPGSFPVATLYLFEHVGFLIIPINIIFAPLLSLLVAINCCAMWQKSKASRPRNLNNNTKNLVSYCGISAGAFAGCPACATGIASLILSGAGITVAGTVSATLAKYQPAIAVLSIGSLVLGLIVLSKRE